jgi:hypothetical protein
MLFTDSGTISGDSPQTFVVTCIYESMELTGRVLPGTNSSITTFNFMMFEPLIGGSGCAVANC